MPDYTILKNSDDFYWYKQKLNIYRKYEQEYHNIPEEFPCGVISKFYDNTYYHNFIYRQEVKCSECGHTSLVWPEQI